MPSFIISYDLRKVRNYDPLWDQLRAWNAVRLLESLWLADLQGPAAAVRDHLRTIIDSDDGVAVISIGPAANWATINCQPPGVSWLGQHFP